jgi:ribonuclease Z
MKITLLGTAGSLIAKNKGCPAILINDDLLLDCGEGTTQKLVELDKIKNIKTICITHLHNDHFLGAFSLLWYFWLSERKEDLSIIGPPQMKSTFETILHLIHTPEGMMSSFKVNYEELKETNTVQTVNRNYVIQYISVEHGFPAFAYRIESKGKSFCYSGDTRPTENLKKIAQDCDLLACECTLPDEMGEFAHKHYHCTPTDVGKIAVVVNTKQLVLTHISSFFLGQIDEFKKIAAKYFKKEVIIAEDLMELEI